MITYAPVRGSVQFTAETATGARGVVRVLREAPIPAHRHRFLREVVLIPAKFIDEALAHLDHAGYDVQAILG